MVHYPAERRRVAPDNRVRDDGRGAFYPGEAAEQLGVKAVASYRQLQTMWWMGRCAQGTAQWPDGALRWPRQVDTFDSPDEGGRYWTRFSLTDIACAREIIRLVGGATAFDRGRRPRFTPIARACQRLQILGVPNPLLDVRLVKDSRSRIIVELPELVVDATTGQLLLSSAFESSIAALTTWEQMDAGVRRALKAEISRTRARYSLAIPEQLVLWAEQPAERSVPIPPQGRTD